VLTLGASVLLEENSGRLDIACLMVVTMKTRPPNNWTTVGSLTTRIAARLMARRQAEISDRPAGNPTAVDPGNEGEGLIADVEQARSAGPTRLNERPPSEQRQGGAGSVGAGGEVIQFVPAWGRHAAGPAPTKPPLQGAGPADYHWIDLAAAQPRMLTIWRYCPYSGVPLGGRTRRLGDRACSANCGR
jgi:hypothetical protein